MTDSEFKCPPLEAVSPLGAEFYTAIGRMAVEWNQLEKHLRHLLSGYIGGRSGVEQILIGQIMTAELGSQGLIHALEAFAEEALSPNERAAVKHATKYYEILRGYRNYYTHDITGIAAGETGGVAMIATADAKGKLVFRTDYIDVSAIEFVAKHCNTLMWYLRYLIVPLHWHLHSHLERPAGLQRPELPNKPPLPNALQKPGKRLGWQPQSKE